MQPELDVVTISLPQIGRKIDKWKSYAVHKDFLTPTNGWDFAFGDDENGDKLVRELGVGLRVTIAVNDIVQCDGYIDTFHISNSRGAGTEVTISGRDLLAPVVDGHLDPTTQFKESQTLEDVLKSIFGHFGFTSFEIDNTANRALSLGQTRGLKQPKASTSGRRRSRRRAPKALSSYRAHQLKPYPSEGAFKFAARVAQRHGLWIWLAADAKTLIVSTPDFDQDVSYSLTRKRGAAGAGNTIVAGDVTRSAQDQPSLLICTGRGGGGANARTGMRVIAINNAVGGPSNQYIINKYPSAKVIKNEDYPVAQYDTEGSRPLFLQDDESQTLEQLENFARRELALRQRKAFDAKYLVEGHAASNGLPWTVDTMVDVQDDILDIHEPLYVLGRTFHKSRQGGTYTELHLIRPDTLVFT